MTYAKRHPMIFVWLVVSLVLVLKTVVAWAMG